MFRILIAEDDLHLANFMRKGLETEGHIVETADDGAAAKQKSIEFEYDLVVLDLNLPTLDGTQVLSHLREVKPALPVIVLTARNRIEDRVQVLDLGADDYLIKPFSFAELSARIRALLRRGMRGSDSVLRYADLELNRVSRTVMRNGKRVDLTTKEFALLEYLMRNSGRRVTRSMIVQNVWNLNFDTMTNVVDVYINYLRKKIDDGQPVRVIHTVRGIGYQLGTPHDVAS
jgi:two-component system copper resistance phosphate regulon response regulator CusR